MWVGLTKLNDLMKSGKFKVFSDLREVFEEIREYHTKPNAQGVPQIVKVKDDLLDAIRYAFMMARHAEQKHLIGVDPDDIDDDYNQPERNAMGY